MPTGFRGRHARTYLNAVDAALATARSVHTETVFSSRLSSNPAPPQLPFRASHRPPHTPGSANSGGHSTGRRNSSNIVMKRSCYMALFRSINRTDEEIFRRLDAAAVRLERLCGTSYRLPQATPRLQSVLQRCRGCRTRFRDLTQRKVDAADTFSNNVRDIA